MNWMMAFSGLMGFVIGFLLVKGSFNTPESVRKFFQLRNAGIMKTVIWALLAGITLNCVLFYFGADIADVPARGFCASAAGGLIAGCGIVLWGMIPAAGFAALGGGRFSVVFALGGMLLAFPVAKFLRKELPVLFDAESKIMKTPDLPENFFALDNPVIWVWAGAVIVLLIVTFAAEKK